MARALLYLRVTSFVGQVKSRLLRLKQPKYLAGAVVGAAWIWFTFLRRLNQPHPGRPGVRPPPEIPLDALPVVMDVCAFALVIAVILNWAAPRRAALTFSEAEIAFLFPAPVNRRMLVHYRLLGAQFGIVLTSLVFSLVFGRGQAFGGNVWFHTIGWWIVLATLNLHFTGTSFVYSKLLNRSLTSQQGRVLALTAIYAVIAVLVLWALITLRTPGPADFASGRAFQNYAAAQVHARPLPWLLTIPKLLMAPYFASGAREFLLALGPAFVVLAAHYFWVVHTEVSFEEASLAKAEKRAEHLRRAQEGDWRGRAPNQAARKPAFKLASSGPPEIAFLWKNLLSTSSVFRPWVAMTLVAIVLAGSQWLLRPDMEGVRFVVLTLTGVLLAATLLLGPLMARQDLRSDLKNADIIKTYPLRGWQVLLGELLTPLAILTAFVWIFLLALFLLVPTDKVAWLAPPLRGAAALGLAVVAPPFIALQLLVPNAAAVIFPAWSLATGNHSERGIEVMGQRIIFMTGQLLITTLAIIPALIGAGLVFGIVQWFGGVLIAGALAAAVICGVLSAEAWIALRWLGARFEQFDLSSELRP
jgi:hypothetical protein